MTRAVRDNHMVETKPGLLVRWMSSSSALLSLLIVNVVVALVIMWMSRSTVLSDGSSYLALAESIMHGEYSQWWQLKEHIPDTFRTPGFPLFLAMILSLFGSEQAVTWVNFALYVLALLLSLRLLKRIDPRPLVRSVFLVLMIPLVNVPFYIAQVYPEIPALAAIMAALYISTRPGKLDILRAIALGALYGFVFQCRPVFLFFPFIMVFATWFVERPRFQWKCQTVVLLTFVVTLIPYGIWNERNHGVFSVTPLEGGGGVLHFGYWAGKIPGYTEHVYWHNFTGDEIVRFTPEEKVPQHIAAYEAEWVEIKGKLDPLLTEQDSLMLRSAHMVDRTVFKSYNSEYTLERERLLKNQTVANIKEDPWYYLAYKSYSAVRLWVIGVQRQDLREATSASRRMVLLYPTVVTGFVFLLALIAVPFAYWRNRMSFTVTYQLLAYVIYFTMIHLPFVIQARYTTPVRMAMVALITLAVVGCFGARIGAPDGSKVVRTDTGAVKG